MNRTDGVTRILFEAFGAAEVRLFYLLGYAAIAIFAAFGVYQMYRYFVSPSLAMIALTVLDAVIIVLTWIEYGRLRREESLRLT